MFPFEKVITGCVISLADKREILAFKHKLEQLPDQCHTNCNISNAAIAGQICVSKLI